LPKSPGLVPVKFNYKPSPSPPPFQPVGKAEFASSGGPKKATKRKKTQASPGDRVLLDFMSNHNQPQVSQQISQQTLKVVSESESEGDSDEEMEDLDSQLAKKMDADEQATQTAQKVMSLIDTTVSTSKLTADPRRDSSGPGGVLDDDISPARRLQGLNINGLPQRTLSYSSTDGSSFSPTDSRKPSLQQSYRQTDSLVTSPLSAHLKDPDSPGQKLPAFQHGSPKDAGSPQATKLPSVVGLIEIADQANENAADELRRRQSSFSVSSTLQFSASSARSPAAFSHTSPILTQSDTTSPRDYRSPPSSTSIPPSYFLPPRRTSAGSEASPSCAFPPPLQSASTSSTDGTSPSTQPTPIEMHHIIDERKSSAPIILPLPIPSVAAAAKLGLTAADIAPGGGFKCDYPGCGAPPFQTQYLLKCVGLTEDHLVVSLICQ
jgi:hypothetical protein